MSKRVITFLGLPGAGKSTQINLLGQTIEATAIHINKIDQILFLEIANLRTDFKERVRVSSATQLDQEFLETAQRQETAWIVLDGFPRNVVQAERMLSHARQHQWYLDNIYLNFPGISAAAFSISRQQKRAQEESRTETAEDRMAKLKRAFLKDLEAINFLKNSKTSFHQVDCTMPPLEVAKEILSIISR